MCLLVYFCLNVVFYCRFGSSGAVTSGAMFMVSSFPEVPHSIRDGQHSTSCVFMWWGEFPVAIPRPVKMRRAAGARITFSLPGLPLHSFTSTGCGVCRGRYVPLCFGKAPPSLRLVRIVDGDYRQTCHRRYGRLSPMTIVGVKLDSMTYEVGGRIADSEMMRGLLVLFTLQLVFRLCSASRDDSSLQVNPVT